MTQHKLYANKYQHQASQFANPTSMIVTLCEKAISCISLAKDGLANGKKQLWFINLGTVQEIINLISVTLANAKNDPTIDEAKKFYSQLSIYTSGLISEKLDHSKVNDLLEAFRIVRDTWKNVDKKYHEMQGTINLNSDDLV